MAKLILIAGAMLIFGIACVTGLLVAEWQDRREVRAHKERKQHRKTYRQEAA